MHYAIGEGSFTANDSDYWRFDALAGDRVSVAGDGGLHSSSVVVELRNASDGVITSASDYYGGHAQITNFEIGADGTYYVKARPYSSSSSLSAYTVRVVASRGIDAESEGNNSTSAASTIVLTPGAAGHAEGRVSGNVTTSSDVDFFNLGNLRDGDVVDVSIQEPATGTLEPRIELIQATTGAVFATATGSGAISFTIPDDDRFYAKVSDNTGASAGNMALYVLDVDITDASNPEVVSTTLPTAYGSGKALAFNDDRVDLPNTVLDGRTNVTTEFWLKTSRTGAQSVLSGANSVNNNEYLVFFSSSTRLQLYYTGGGDAFSNVGWDIPSIADNSWHHFSVVRDDTNDRALLYLDGTFRGERSAALSALSIETNGLVIGQDQDSVGGSFDSNQALYGELDELRVWDHARTGTEIRADMNRTVVGDESGLLACWNFDEGTGTTAGDCTTNGYDGTLVGGTWVDSTAPPNIDPDGALTVSYPIDSFSTEFNEDLLVSAASSGSNYDLREAGADGAFDTGDDNIYALNPSYSGLGSTSVSFTIDPNPLSAGTYRFQTLSGLTDRAGNAVDQFTRTFIVADPVAGRIENSSNDSIPGATPLPMTETPAGSGLYTGFGVGTFFNTSDRDYWRFDAEPGDRLTVRLEAPGASIYPQIYVQNAAGSNLITTGGDYYGIAQIQDYQFTAPGTYYALVYSPYNRANYQMRVDLARGPQLETEGNDSQGAADELSFNVPSTGSLQSKIAGALVSSDPGDYFYLGNLNTGNAVSISVSLPSFGTLETGDVELSIEQAGSSTPLLTSTSGSLNVTLPDDALYYARVRALANNGIRSTYLLSTSVTDGVAPDVTGSTLPAEGTTSTAIIDRFDVFVSEDLDPDYLADNLGALFELRAAGDDGSFYTPDDELYALSNSPGYTSGKTVSLRVVDGPLQLGNYRFTATGLHDRAGNAMAADFTQTFDVAGVPPYLLENRDNGSFYGATSLSPTPTILPDGSFSISYSDGTEGDLPYSITTGHLNNDTGPDVVVGNYNGHNVSVFLSNCDGTFADPVVYGTDNNPLSVVIADFDGDNVNDVATANNNSAGSASVLLNNGDGTLAAKVDYATGSYAYDVLAADLNQDGYNDLAVANRSGHTVSILINKADDTGAFHSAVNYSTGSSTGPVALAHADATNDGHKDLVVALYDIDSIGVLPANTTSGVPDGTFGAISSTYSVGDGPLDVIAFDADADGDADFATANNRDDTMSVLTYEAGAVTSTNTFYSGGDSPHRLVAAHLTDDGDLDLAVTNYGSYRVGIHTGDGGGGFTNTFNYYIGGRPIAIAADDLNGDALTDLATADYNGDSFTVLAANNIRPLTEGPTDSGVYSGFGRGNLTGNEYDYWSFAGEAGQQLQVSVEHPSSPNFSGLRFRVYGPDGTQLTNFYGNQYGYPYRGEGNSAVLNLGTTGTYWVRAERWHSYEGEYRVRATTVDAGTQFETENNDSTSNADSLALANTSLGILEAEVVGYIGVSDPGDVYRLGNANAGTIVTLDVSLPSTSPLNPVMKILDSSSTAVATSTAGDSTLSYEIPTGGDGFYYARIESADTTTRGLASQYILDVTIADTTPPEVTGMTLPADGATSTAIIDRFDVFVSEDLDPANDFVASCDLRAAGVDGLFDTADDEIYSLNNSPVYSSGLSISYRIGDGPLQPGHYRCTVGGLVDKAGNPMAADFTQTFDVEGIPPFVLENRDNDSFGAATSLSPNPTAEPDGSFTVSYTDGTDGSRPYAIATGHLNDDTCPDVVVGNFNSHNIAVFISNCDGAYADPVLYDTGNNPLSVVIADLDGDLVNDVAVANHGSASASVLLNNGDGTLAAKVDYATGTNAYQILAEDFNNDDSKDLAIANYNSDTVSVLINKADGTGIFEDAVNYNTGSGSGPLALAYADVTADGNKDLIVSLYKSDAVGVLPANTDGGGVPDGTFGALGDTYSVGDQPLDLVAFDADGDGDADVATANQADNTVTVLIKEGGAVTATNTVSSGGSNPYRLVAAQLTDDAIPDLAVANYGSYHVGILQNQGDGSFVNSSSIYLGGRPIAIAADDSDGDGLSDLFTADYNGHTFSVLTANNRKPLTEDPTGSGVYSGFGRGNLTGGEYDYWSFTAEAGQQLQVSSENPGGPNFSGLRYYIFGPDGNTLTNFTGTHYYPYRGEGNSSVVTLPTTGTYWIRTQQYYSYEGEYRIRATLADADAQFGTENNDSTSSADTLVMSQTAPQTLTATAAGYIGASDTSGDYYFLGYLDVGSTIDLSTRLPSTSTLDPKVEVVFAGQVLLDDDGDPNDGTAQVTTSVGGAYYAHVLQKGGTGGLLSQYLLDVQIADANPPEVISTSLPESGETTTQLIDSFSLGVNEQLDLSFTDDLPSAVDLRAAGDDGSFDTFDDEIYTLGQPSVSGLTYSFSITDCPLQLGEYRLSVDNITDRAGNTIVPFVRLFEVAPVEPFTIEDRDNDTAATATPLILVEDPTGLKTAAARGKLRDTSDVDYYSFEGTKDDLLLVSSETVGNPNFSGLYYEVRKADGTFVTSFYGNQYGYPYDGRGNSPVVALPADDIYTVRVSRWYNYFGEYRIRVTTATPPLQLESELNDNVSQGDPLTLTVDGDTRFGSVAGFVGVKSDDLDYFNIGTVAAGETIFLTSRTPQSSSLQPVVGVYDASGGYVVESGSGRPFDGVGQVNVVNEGTYYAAIRAGNATGGLLNQYVFDVNIVPTGSVDFPNLQVTNITLPSGSPKSGEDVTFDYTVKNVGSQPTSVADWSERVVLSTNTTLGDEDDVTLCICPHSGALDPGDSYIATQTVSLPDGIFGDFYMFVETDVHNSVNEFLLEGDNTTISSGTFHVDRAPYADLRIENLAVSDPDAIGDVTVSWTAANRGDGQAAGGFNERVRITNPAIGATIVNTVLEVTDTLDVDGTLSRSFTQQIDGKGTYQIVVTTDSDEKFFEYNTGGHTAAEQNNTVTASLDITVDLEVTDSTVAPATVAVGEQLSVDWTVTNNGTGRATPNWTDRVYFSTDQVVQSSDILLASKVHQTAVPGGGTYNASANGTVPGSTLPGNYYVIIVTDYFNNEAEDNEGNNVRVHPVQVEVVAPDLVPVDLEVVEPTLQSGVSGTLRWTEENTGNADTAASWNSYVRIVNERTGSTLATTVVPYGGGALAAGETADREYAFTLPHRFPGVGDIRFTVTSDWNGAVTEQNSSGNGENNNTIAITKESTLAPYADLELINLSVEPSQLQSGLTATFSWDVKNTGNADTPESWNDYVRVVNLTTGATLATQVVTCDAGPLTPGSQATCEYSFDLPDNAGGVGDIQFTVTTDWYGTVIEENADGTGENNNSASITRESIFSEYADLVVANLHVEPASGLESGNTMTIKWDNKNQGDEDTAVSWYDRIVVKNLDTGEILRTTNLYYNRNVCGDLGPGDVCERSYNVLLPDGPRGAGELQITVTVDYYNYVFEHDPDLDAEANNTATTTVTSDLAAYADLIVSNLRTEPASGLESGDNVTIRWDSENQGGRATNGSWYERVQVGDPDTGLYLVNANYFYNRGTVGNGDIAAGDSRTRSYSFKLPNGPSGAGDFDITVTTDYYNNIFEYTSASTAETNNATTASFSSTVAAYPDLVVDDLQILTGNGLQSGDTFTASWNSKNQGDAATTGSWYERLVIANESTGKTLLSTNLYYNRNASGNGDIGVGNSRARSYVYTLPQGPAGEGDIKATVTIDYYNNVFEYTSAGDAETNNTSSTTRTATLAPYPDAVVTSIVAPSNASPGEVLTDFTYTVTNQGNGDLTGSRTDHVYLANNPAGTNGRYLASYTYDIDIPVSESLARSGNRLALPTFETGDRWLVVRTDGGNNIFENNAGGTAETNNTTVAATPTNFPASLIVSLDRKNVSETGGAVATRGTVTRTDGSTGARIVTLTSSDTASARVPASVTIAAGKSSARFDVEAVDNIVVDGPRDVTISASADGFTDGSSVLNVTDNDVPVLTVSIEPVNVVESDDPVRATLTRNTDVSVELIVNLNSSNTDKLTVPMTVTIPVDAASVDFDVTPVDNTTLEGQFKVAVTASVAGYRSGSDSVLVDDDDIPELSLTLQDPVVSELADNPATYGTVTRTGPTDDEIYVSIFTDNLATGGLQRVLIPAGKDNEIFPITIIHDGLVKGDQVVELTAFPLDTAFKLPLPEGQASAELTILEGDGPALVVDIADSLVGEGNSTTATVTRNTDTGVELVVTLNPSDPTKVSVPTTVTIEAEAASAQFVVDALENFVQDGNVAVSVTASAADHTAGIDNFVVSDADIADLRVEAIDIVPSEAPARTGEFYEVIYRAANRGRGATTASWLDRVYISSSRRAGTGSLIGSAQMSEVISVGGEYEGSVFTTLPDTPGIYYIHVVTNPQRSQEEGSYSNNLAVSEPFEVLPKYRATVETDVDLAPTGAPVPLYGRSYDTVTGDPSPFQSVSIRVERGKFRRTLSVFTDQNGEFTTNFVPLPNEAGTYTIGADHPGVEVVAPQDSFVLAGMRASPGSANYRVFPGTPLSATFNLQNLGDTPLTGISATIENAPPDVEVEVDVAEDLDASATATVSYTLLANTGAAQISGQIRIKLTSDEGAVATHSLNLTIAPHQPKLATNPGFLNRGMLRGEVTTVEAALTNIGGAPTGELDVLLPDFPWLKLATPKKIAPLAPGESTNVILVLTPSDTLALTKFTGAIAINGPKTSVTLPFSFRSISEAVGDLQVDVLDDFTYYAEGNPKVEGATVRVTDPLDGTLIATGVTDETGSITFEGIREGDYQITVSAKQHGTWRSGYTILPGITNVTEVFIAYETVSYRWTVVPTEIEDHYKIELESVFETEVPIPVVTIDTPFLTPLVIQGEETIVNIRVTNHGLIAAHRVEVVVPQNDPNFVFTPLVDVIDTLPAKSSVEIPVAVEALPTVAFASNTIQPQQFDYTSALSTFLDSDPYRIQDTRTSFTGCQAVPTFKVKWGYYCGDDFQWHALQTQILPVCVTKDCWDDFFDQVKDDAIKALKEKLKGESLKDYFKKNLKGIGCGLLDKLLPCIDPCLASILKMACGVATRDIKGAISGALKFGSCWCPDFSGSYTPSSGGGGGGGGGWSPTGGGGGPGNPWGNTTTWDFPDVNCTPGDAFGGEFEIGSDGVVISQSGGVCARVRIRIEQEAVMTRTGFLGTLELDNGHTDSNLTNIELVINIEDDLGNSANDKFFYGPPELVDLSAVDGTGTVAPDTTGIARYTFIPTREAAPEAPTVYKIGGTLRYTDGEDRAEVPLYPATITVYPDANLVLNYFHQRDVYSDDPFTEEIEEAEPFDLGLIVTNTGKGAARNFSITTAQPEIVENEKGLLIDFKIIGTQVGAEEVTPSLTVNLGDIAPSESQVARFILTSTLQGKFIDYEATFKHDDDLGGEKTSLIESVDIHELIHTVQAQRTTDDNLPDFLVNDEEDPDSLPDTLYLSDGTVAPVNIATDVVTDGAATLRDVEVEVSANQPSGFTYLRFADPSGGGLRLKQVLRSDGGEVLVGPNAWTTNRTFRDSEAGARYENLVHIFDYDGTGSYTLVYEKLDSIAPTIANHTNVKPNPRSAPVEAVKVTFSEILEAGTFDYNDLTLTRDGGANLITSAVQVALVEGTNATYQVSGLTALTTDSGNYALTIDPAGVEDTSANIGEGDPVEISWVNDTEHATAAVEQVDPAPRNIPVTTVDVTFSKAIEIASFDCSDLELTYNGDVVACVAQVTALDAAGTTATTFRISNLDGETAEEGAYELTVDATGVLDALGEDGVGSDSTSWVMDTTAPTITALSSHDTPRSIVVTHVDVTLSEPLNSSTFTRDDVALTRDGGPNLITDDLPEELLVTVEHLDGLTYRVANVNWVSGLEGNYTLTVDAAGTEDLAGNAGTGTASVSWEMDLTPPPAPVIVAVTPDTGESDSDRLINTKTFTLTGTVAEEGVTVRIVDETAGDDLGRAEMFGTTFSLEVEVDDPGVHRYSARAADDAANVSPDSEFFDVFVDVVAPKVRNFSQITSPRTDVVSTVDVTFSESLALSTFDRDDLSLTRTGDATNLINDGVEVTALGTNRTTFRISGLGALTGPAGAYTLTVLTSGVEDRAGNPGAEQASVKWTNNSDATDTTAPTSQVAALPSESATLDIAVEWSAQDNDGGSGLRYVDVYVSDDGGGFALWQAQTTGTSATYTGAAGHTYAFYSVATDNAGNVEAGPVTPDAQTTIALGEPAVIRGTKFHDHNADGEQQPGEDGLEGWEIFIDLDGDFEKDDGEPSATTASDGTYEISVNQGIYRLAEAG